MLARVVVEGGAIVHEEGDRSDVPWWSVTKTVIAAAALVLVGEGRLDLDAPLPGRPYTLRLLLQHRAGLRDYGGVVAYKQAVARHEAAWPPEVMLERARADQPAGEPGTAFGYSNIGYFFVREIVERAAGAPLGPALDRLVLQPLGIAGVRLATGRGELAPDYDSRWVYHGSLIGPLARAALFMDGLLSGRLLRPDLLTAMLERVPIGDLPEGLFWKSAAYGLGIAGGRAEAGPELIGHTGGGPGSTVAVYRGSRRTAATFGRDEDQMTVEQSCEAMLI
ncbi:MAG: beta-lactamase family protein [Reyranella sp.]|uniref:serine hydrolase domain-containing protein n=1 Tax=Reyranella sp. TaxID=1929291 RepID=UPI001AD0FBFA|nr:serine hydrolase domain-containing protein [Reyranella sp.]MBN9089415.1 beta-lactamase family protein [Reyranella sp.]